MSKLRAAFTLLEICLVLAIGAVLILLAVPSVSGLLAEQRLHESFNKFQQFASSARSHSMREQKPYRLVWDKEGIAMLSTDRDSHGDPVVVDHLDIGKEEAFQVARPAAFSPKPDAEWVFWPNGVCEPVVVSYKGPNGKWKASFDPLTSHGTFMESQTL
jgi:Tfp pilus assembly protein FimT